MTPEESNLISGLFQRLRGSDSAPKDAQALQFIQGQVAAQPSAPYLLVQTVLVQEQALKGAQAQIAQLQAQLAQASQGAAKPQGGFLSGLLHPRSSAPGPVPGAPPLPGAPPAQAAPAPAYAPQGYVAQQPAAGGGGGFLKGALSTAAGVAGGALLFQGIESLLGHNSGPFGSVMGGGGFGGGGWGGSGFGGPSTENVEVVNNYYGNDNPSFLPKDSQNDETTDENDQDQYQDQPDDSQLADADSGYDDPGVDSNDGGGDWGGDGGDSGGGGDYA